MIYVYFQGWLNHRNPQEAEIILNLFDGSFSDMYRYAVQNLTFKMNLLEAFVIKQVCEKFCVCYNCTHFTDIYIPLKNVDLNHSSAFISKILTDHKHFKINIQIPYSCLNPLSQQNLHKTRP